MTHDDNINFSINQVAKMIGVVPATIRNWEKYGLIEAKRSSNNYRRFSLDDINTLKKIKEYSIDKKMGVQAIKMLLPNNSSSSLVHYLEHQNEQSFSKKLISNKWKEIRKRQGYTLKQVSEAVGISTSQLCKFENGGNISLDQINDLAHFYNENPLSFLNTSSQDKHLVRKNEGEPFQLKNDPGIEMLSLVSMREHSMYPVLCTVQPGCGNTLPHKHNGQEFIYLLSGKLEIHLNDDRPYIVNPGDSFYYSGLDKHCWKNISNKPAQLLWIHCVVTM